jgi:hypothetical protein
MFSWFMAVPHYTYLTLKMPGPNGIITVKGSFEFSDLYNKEFHKMAQNFSMIANYGEPKGKAGSATTGITKQLEGHPAEPEMKKPRVQLSDPKEAKEKRKRPRQHRQQAYKSRVEKIRLLSHELS